MLGETERGGGTAWHAASLRSGTLTVRVRGDMHIHSDYSKAMPVPRQKRTYLQAPPLALRSICALMVSI